MNANLRVILLEALAIVYSLTAAAFHSDHPPVVDYPAGLLRLAIPAAAALAGLLLRDASSDPSHRPPHAAAVDLMVAVAFAALAELVLFVFKPELVLPRWAPTQGGYVGSSLVVICRALFRPDPTRAAPDSAPEAAKNLLRSKRAYLAAANVVAGLAIWLIWTGDPKARIASALLLSGSLILIYRISRITMSHFADAPGEYIECRVTLLRQAGYWYYASVFPGVLILLAGSPVYPYWLALAVLIAAEWNHRSALSLRELARSAAWTVAEGRA